MLGRIVLRLFGIRDPEEVERPWCCPTCGQAVTGRLWKTIDREALTAAYVADRITVEQYERALENLEASRPWNRVRS